MDDFTLPYKAADSSGYVKDKNRIKEGTTDTLDKGTRLNWISNAPEALDTSTGDRGLTKAAQCRNRASIHEPQELRPLCPSHELVAPNELAIMSAIENGGPVSAGADTM